jgi:hypothetical protein
MITPSQGVVLMLVGLLFEIYELPPVLEYDQEIEVEVYI